MTALALRLVRWTSLKWASFPWASHSGVDFLKASLAAVLIAGLSLPLVQMSVRRFKEQGLQGYTPALAERPAGLVSAWFDRRLQQWAEAYVGVKIGFRGAFVKTYNEVSFRLFHSLPHLEVVDVPPGELIYRRHVLFLNESVLKRAELAADYGRRARRAFVTQQSLARKGTHLLMVIAPSKGGSYPDMVPRRFLARESAALLAAGVHYGDVLAQEGVNVLDFAREFRALRPTAPFRLDAPYGVHWNFYAGCLAAQRMLARLETLSGDRLGGVGCDPAVIEPSQWTDIDGLSMLNLWKPERYLRPLPYPTIQGIAHDGAVKPRMLFIGDSFSDQARRAFSLARVFEEVAFASYFSTLRRVGIDDELNQPPEKPIDRATFDLAPGGVPYRYVVLQSVDYNLSHKDFGFFETVLKRVLPRLESSLVVDPRSPLTESSVLISGWGEATAAGRPVTSWPATLAFQSPAQPGPRHLTLRVALPDGPVSLNLRVNGRSVPLRSRADDSGSGGTATLTAELPAEALADDFLTTLSFAPTDPEMKRTVVLTGGGLE